MAVNQIPINPSYSEAYRNIKKESESWPEWKVDAYNNSIVSPYVKKLERK